MDCRHVEDDPRCVVDVESVITVMHDLGREIHWEILGCLIGSAKCVSRIANELELSASDTSKSLSVLAEYGLVHMDREKTAHIYRPSALVTVSSIGEAVVRFVGKNSSILSICHTCLPRFVVLGSESAPERESLSSLTEEHRGIPQKHGRSEARPDHSDPEPRPTRHPRHRRPSRAPEP